MSMNEEQARAAMKQARDEKEKTAKLAGTGAGVVAGAQLGTCLIPIPIVGTFTGALVGGLVGTKIGKKVGGALLDQFGAENSYAAQATPGGTQPSERVNLSAEFEKLVQLRDAGILSEEEFKAAKAKLLGL
jgi:phage tail tape-measure protein